MIEGCRKHNFLTSTVDYNVGDRMIQYISISHNKVRNIVMRGVILASLLVQMWPVSVAQAKDVAIAATPEAAPVVAPVVRDAAVAPVPTVSIISTDSPSTPQTRQLATPASQVQDNTENVSIVPTSSTAEKPVADAIDIRTEPLLYAGLEVDSKKVHNGKQLKLSLFVQASANATQTLSGLSIVATLPIGLEPKGTIQKPATYDPVTRQIVWGGLSLKPGQQFKDDGVKLDLSVVIVPTNLQISLQVIGIASADAQVSSAQVWIGSDVQTDQPIDSRKGGKAKLGSRIELDFPPNALKTNSVITSAEYAETVTTSTLDLPLEFGPEMMFDAPVTLTLDLNGLVDDKLLAEAGRNGRWPMLFYLRDVSDTFVYTDVQGVAQSTLRVQSIPEVVPSSYDTITGKLVARLQHFSNYVVSLAIPPTPSPWQLKANAPGVALFSGAECVKHIETT